MNINSQAGSGEAFLSFDDDPDARLDSVVQRLAHHPDPVARYVGSIGVVCDLSLQRDAHGMHIAADTALDFLDGDEVRHFTIRTFRDSTGRILGFHDVDGQFPDGDRLIDLVGVIALLEPPRAREILLRAATMAVIAEPTARWASAVSTFIRSALQPAHHHFAES